MNKIIEQTCIKLFNNHIVIFGSQTLLLDTGSPVSFHPSGILKFEEKCFKVLTNIGEVTPQYLSEKVGCVIDGIMGMDIINRFPSLISLKDNWMFIDDDAAYHSHFQMYSLPSIAGGLLGITVLVNHHRANLIVDTGAPISYIQSEFVNGLDSVESMNDFSPYVGIFKTNTYLCEVDFLIDTSRIQKRTIRFGIPPAIISNTLNQLTVDGIIGVDLFKELRLQIKDRILFVPPQGI